jgi:hypothetical protein
MHKFVVSGSGIRGPSGASYSDAKVAINLSLDDVLDITAAIVNMAGHYTLHMIDDPAGFSENKSAHTAVLYPKGSVDVVSLDDVSSIDSVIVEGLLIKQALPFFMAKMTVRVNNDHILKIDVGDNLRDIPEIIHVLRREERDIEACRKQLDERDKKRA